MNSATLEGSMLCLFKLIGRDNSFLMEMGKIFGMWGRVLFFLLLIALPSLASATNNDPFRSGREAVNPKPSIGLSQSSGAMTYSYPLIIPPGRNGVQPDLSLSYSSADKRQDSLYGYGWSLNLPYIERTNKLGTNNFYNQDRDHTFFTSSMSGELLPVKSTVPIGGGFLGASQVTPFMPDILLGADNLSYFASDTPVAAGDLREKKSGKAQSRNFSTRNPIADGENIINSIMYSPEKILHTFVYHPNEEMEFRASQEQAANDFSIPVQGFDSPKTPIASGDFETEIMSERTERSQKYLVQRDGSLSYVYHLFASPVFYKNSATGLFDEIDTSIEEGVDTFVMSKASYHITLAKNLDVGTPFLIFDHDGQKLDISTPMAKEKKQDVAKRADVQGPDLIKNHRIAYSDIFGNGIGVEVTTLGQSAKEDVVIQNQDVLGDLSGKDYVEFPFDVDSDTLATITSDGSVLDRNADRGNEMGTSTFGPESQPAADLAQSLKPITTFVSSSTVVVTDEQGVSTYIYPPIVEDSSGNIQSIDIEYTLTNKGFRMTKRVPVQFLLSAVYPIRTDATFSVISGSGDGYTRSSATSWSSVHDAVTTNNTLGYTNPTIRADSAYSAGTYYISRSFLPFDTSFLGSSAVISSSTLYITPDSRTVADSVAQNYLVVVGPTTQAATSSLVVSDYNKCGATTSPVQLSSRYAYSQTWSPGTAVAFPLNGSGTSTISKTGYTKLGIRSGFDVENVAPSGNNVWTYDSYDMGIYQPYLAIETAVVGPLSPSSLQVEGLTNPANISLANPSFSAIFQSTFATDTAVAYEIQIATSTDWTSVFWDSAKQTLSSSTSNGQRIPNIYSTSSLPIDGAKYYWRIKFWNSTNMESPWSTGYEYFVMQIRGDYMAKVDDGAYMRYALQSDGSWVAYDKRGWKYTFGASTNGRLNDPNASSSIYRWYLEEMADTSGNRVLYRYQKDLGQVYPYFIDYTDHQGGPLAEIYFTTNYRGSSLDWATSSIYGFPINTRKVVTDITSAVNGIIVHRWTPAYTTGDNQSRTLLNSIQETGYKDSDGTGALTLPATTFKYQTGTSTWTQVTDSNLYQVGFDLTNTTNDDKGYRLFDVNGDGLPDWVKSDGVSQAVYFNTGRNWGTASSSWNIPLAFSVNNVEQGVRVVDVNGDGLSDIIAASSSRVVYINNGVSGWVASTSFTFPVSFVDSQNRDLGVQVVDLNGDGLPDVFRSYFASTTGTSSAVYVNNGFGWIQDSGWSIPEVLINDLKDSAVRIYDYNGDGLPDLVFSPYPSSGAGGQPVRVYYNTGRGWQRDTNSLTVPFAFADIATTIDSADRGIRFADFNGDGCVDIAQGLSSVLKDIRMSNCGSGWNVAVQNTLPEYFRDSASDYGVRMEDINGDGQLDMVRGYFTGTTSIRKVYLKNGSNPDLLSEIMNSSGGKIRIGYQSSAQYVDASGNLANPNLPVIIQTVRTLTTDNGAFLSVPQRIIATTTYDYQRGFYYATASDPYSRVFAGFGLVVEAKPNGAATKTYFHQGNWSDANNGEYLDHISKAGRAYLVESIDGTTTSSKLYSQVITNWGRSSFSDGRNFVRPLRKLERTYDGGTTPRDHGISYGYDDMNGNLTSISDSGEVNGFSNGQYLDSGDFLTDSRVTTYAYSSSSTLPAMSLPQLEVIQDQGNNVKQETRYYYDNMVGWGYFTRGLLTHIERRVNSLHTATEIRGYDDYGLLTSITDPKGNPTYYGYNSYHLFPTTITNALSQTKTIAYDYSSGKSTDTWDVNGYNWRNEYDNLDRLIKEWRPDNTTPTSLDAVRSYAYTDSTTTPSSVRELDWVDAVPNQIDNYTYSDGFGRTIQTKREAELQNGWITNDTLYNNIGAVSSSSLPYFSGSSGWSIATNTAYLYVNNFYDTMGRIATVTDSVGTTQTAYANWRTRVTDPLGNKKDYWNNAFGQLVNVVEYPNGPATTTYSYNQLSKLVKLTDASGNVRNFTYDMLGQLMNSEDLHTQGDTLFGSTTRAYDDAGNLSTYRNARGDTITYSYDVLNRPTSEDATSTAGVDISYIYDSCYGGKGKLCSAVRQGSATTTYAYDGSGHVATEAKQIKGVWGTSTYTYMWNGKPEFITMPDGFQLFHAYDAAGYLTEIDTHEATDTYWYYLLWKEDYSPTDQPTVIGLHYSGFPLYASSTYDQAHNYRLSGKKVQTGNATIYTNSSYVYDALGRITQFSDTGTAVTRKNISYGYDALSRLTSASTTATGYNPPYKEAFTYDNLGNLTNKTDTNYAGYTYDGTGSYNYAGTGYANPDAPTTMGNSTYTYDADGNVTSIYTTGVGTTTYVWDPWNRLSSSYSSSTGTTTYAYDYSGARVYQAVPTAAYTGATTTRYFSRFYRETPGGYVRTRDVYAGDTFVASRERTGTQTAYNNYITTDHLGGVNLITWSNHAYLADLLDPYPFGANRVANPPGSAFVEQKKFIGQYYDNATNLSYLNARYYDGKRGQFISEDPMFRGDPNRQRLMNPQELNAYSYAANNPVNWSDPSGRITQAQQIQTLQLQVQLLSTIVALYQTGATQQANGAYSRYQNIVGSTGYISTMGSINTTGDKVQTYSQGSGLPNKIVDKVVTPQGAAVSGAIGALAAGGAGYLLLPSVAPAIGAVGDAAATGRTLQNAGNGAKLLKDAGNGRTIETLGQGVETATPDVEIMWANFRQTAGWVWKGAAALITGGVITQRLSDPVSNREGVEGD